MRKALYGTTALAAAALVAADASAASGLQLGITGYYRNSIGGTWGRPPATQHLVTSGGAVTSISTAGLGNFDRQSVSMRQEIRVNFTGETTLDNGITVRVLVGLNGENVAKSNNTLQIDRAYADFSGKFGLVRIGEANGALTTDCVTDPGNVTANFGVNSPNESYSNVGYAQRRNQQLQTANVSNSGAGYFSTFGVGPVGSIGTCYGIIEGKGNKIQYYSPTIGGFNFGISFTPTGGQRLAGGGLAYGTDVTAPGPGNAGNNILSVGADYSHSFGGWSVTAGGGGEWAFTQYTAAGATAPKGQRASWYQGGVQVGFGHVVGGVSGAYYANYPHAGYPATTASPSDDGWVLSAGVSYTIDAWSFGLQGVYGSYGQSALAILGTSPPGAHVDREQLWGISLNGAYALGPGISLEAQLAYTEADYGNVSALGVTVPVPTAVGVHEDQVHAWEIDAGTAINF
jgi:outer membrane protein OmpU